MPVVELPPSEPCKVPGYPHLGAPDRILDPSSWPFSPVAALTQLKRLQPAKLVVWEIFINEVT